MLMMFPLLTKKKRKKKETRKTFALWAQRLGFLEEVRWSRLRSRLMLFM